jgi:hypothetical protein
LGDRGLRNDPRIHEAGSEVKTMGVNRSQSQLVEKGETS